MLKDEKLDVILNNMQRNPNHWRIDQFRAIHRSGVRIWIGNGLWGYHIEAPNYYEPSLRERLKLRRLLKQLKQQQTTL